MSSGNPTGEAGDRGEAKTSSSRGDSRRRSSLSSSRSRSNEGRLIRRSESRPIYDSDHDISCSASYYNYSYQYYSSSYSSSKPQQSSKRSLSRSPSPSASRQRFRSESPDYRPYHRPSPNPKSSSSPSSPSPPSAPPPTDDPQPIDRPRYRASPAGLANLIRDQVRVNYRMDQQEVRRADAALKKFDPKSTQRARLMTEYLCSRESRTIVQRYYKGKPKYSKRKLRAKGQKQVESQEVLQLPKQASLVQPLKRPLLCNNDTRSCSACLKTGVNLAGAKQNASIFHLGSDSNPHLHLRGTTFT